MDNIDDTPASPVPDHEWDNTGKSFLKIPFEGLEERF